MANSRLPRLVARVAFIVLTALAALAAPAGGQEAAVKKSLAQQSAQPRPASVSSAALPLSSSTTASRYLDPLQGVSAGEIVRRALVSNTELAAVRLDIERARARIGQAELRPNPTVEFEQTTGKFTGSAGERETSIGLSLPLELNGQRQRRMSLARAELEAVIVEVADRERRLAAEVRAAYADTLAAARELEITEGLNNLDVETARIVEARVTEGESAPLELNLLGAEVDRLRSRRALVEGRLQVSLLRLKTLAGIPPDEPLRLRDDLAATVTSTPGSLEAALDIALRTRPDVRLARLNEKVAEAGLELARAQARPDVTAFTRYSTSRSVFDDTPVGVLRDRDKTVSFGISVGIPLFNRNQGAKAEASVAIAQAKRRRESVEQYVRAEVASAYARHEAARAALAIYEQGVLARTSQNANAFRKAYELGAFRMTELLAEQRRFLGAQREYTEALTERYKASADLLSAIGSPFSPDAPAR